MPFDPVTCEPLRVWSRLEPRARDVEFDGALQARTADPLWMLARQWQFGEFKAEDAGSAVIAKLARRTTPIAEVRTGSGSFAAFDAAVPLEARVERLELDPPPAVRASAGRRFLGMLDEAAEDLPATAAPYDAAHYAAHFRERFPFRVVELDADDPADVVPLARRRSRARAHRMKLALSGRALDGFALVAVLRPGMAWSDLPGDLAVGVHADHAAMVLEALERYRAWVDDLYTVPGATDRAWQPAELEYGFSCTVPRDDGSAVVLAADEYASGSLDWFSFDLGAVQPSANGAPAADLDVRSVIPSPVEYAGMPKPRWWEFEDGDVDLGGVRADTTDLAKVIVAEFALLYGNNWLMIPVAQPVGTLAEIEGIVVTDTFGQRTLVEAATGSSGGVWSRWDFFSLAPSATSAAAPPLGQHLFLPPVAHDVAESDPLEAVAFVRDEASNLVWAVESRVPDGGGSGADGATVARRFEVALDDLERGLGGGGDAVPVAPDAQLRYRLGTSVPEHWIPFLPVHMPGGTREIRLQRAAMPRFVLGTAQPVRPLTSILREGLRTDDTTAAALFVNEEEVTPAGVVVEGTMQRTRWFGGATDGLARAARAQRPRRGFERVALRRPGAGRRHGLTAVWSSHLGLCVSTLAFETRPGWNSGPEEVLSGGRSRVDGWIPDGIGLVPLEGRLTWRSSSCAGWREAGRPPCSRRSARRASRCSISRASRAIAARRSDPSAPAGRSRRTTSSSGRCARRAPRRTRAGRCGSRTRGPSSAAWACRRRCRRSS